MRKPKVGEKVRRLTTNVTFQVNEKCVVSEVIDDDTFRVDGGVHVANRHSGCWELIEENSELIVNTYKHLLHRVDYPAERGYRTEPCSLPPWLYITVTEDKNRNDKYLTVHSRIHVNKAVKLNPTYSSNFSDVDIIKDLSSEVLRRFIN